MILVDRQAAERYAAQGLWARETLDGLLARAAAEQPDAVALIDARGGGDEHATWRDIDERVSMLAGVLLDCGLRQDEVVGVQLDNSPDAVVVALAILRAGLVAAPLPILWRRRELAEACRRTGAAALVTAG